MARSMDHAGGVGAPMPHGGGMGGAMGRPWLMLAVMTVVHVAIMYVLMFSMIDRAANFVNNINMSYMAVLMAAPITAVMVLSMWGMYPGGALKAAVVAVSLLLGLLAWLAIRQQWAVGDEEFLRSMIPHHSGAILMCQEARLSDPRVIEICGNIVPSQQAEIAQMREVLRDH